MKWRKDTEWRLISDSGYMICKCVMNAKKDMAYVARLPSGKILHSGMDYEKAKAACNDHFESTQEKAA
ncbi:hypothetical protein BK660_21820 [Pseudomonas brassicacearum]|uniref:Uncharacterized protein n=1 Tax=Pseudomonas brassicacearum TaxID=930166 RepID=A0A423HXI7_9PSED|nr:hypothetical protein [Pseudomonas brassicacearum]RON17930.1 hypothetical protein BK660_21820 [Pseudomonas brassicacearum]